MKIETLKNIDQLKAGSIIVVNSLGIDDVDTNEFDKCYETVIQGVALDKVKYNDQWFRFKRLLNRDGVIIGEVVKNWWRTYTYYYPK